MNLLNHSAVAVLAAGLAIARPAPADEPSLPNLPIHPEAFPAPQRSSDGAVRVFGRKATSLEKVQILHLTEAFRRKFHTFSGLEMRALSVDLLLGDPTAGRERAPRIDASVENRFGEWGGVVKIGGAVEIADLHAALAQSWMAARLANARNRSVSNGIPPAWIATGLSRLVGHPSRADDTEQVVERWMKAGLPRADFLVAKTTVDSPPLAAELTAWLLHAHGKKPSHNLEALLNRLSSSTNWSARLAGDFMGCAPGPELDESWARWLLSRREQVLSPGDVTPMNLARFLSELLLYAGESGMPVRAQWIAPAPLNTLISYRDRPWAARVARIKSATLRKLAYGRGPELESVAEDFSGFLDGVRRNFEREELWRRWKVAWDHLDRLRYAVETGQTGPARERRRPAPP